MGKKSRVSKRENVDALTSDRQGLAWLLETFMRRFNTLMHIAMITPLYAMAAACIGTALLPGLFLIRYVFLSTAGLSEFVRIWILGASIGAGYFFYGFTLVLLVPLLNLLMRIRLSAWRGGYYSLEAIPWYIHNGSTYLVRYTFLEFITPTPINILFFRMMGMKVGRGTIINTSHISDPSLITMGKKVTIGGSATIVGHYGQGGYLVLAPVKIGDRATIGLRATIMGGADIGEGAKILPNSVVLPKTIVPAGETWGGVPAKKIIISKSKRRLKVAS